MGLDYWLGGFLAVGLTVYLVYVMLRPERL
jgi:K+-transporting ATPase KdpF subunit